jgi:O-antigen/teichoic acid export membrane protein
MNVAPDSLHVNALRKLTGSVGQLSWSHAGELFWLCAGQGVSLLLGILTIKLLTSMGPAEYGIYALVGTVGALVSSIFYGPFEQGIVRFYFDYARQGQARRLMSLFYSCLVFGGTLCLVGGLAVALAIPRTGTYLSPLLVISATLFVILTSTANPFNPMLNLLRKRRENAILQMLERLLGLLFILAVFRVMAHTATTALFALCGATILVIAAKGVLLHCFLPEEEQPDKRKGDGNRTEMLRVVGHFSLPFVIWGLAGWLQSNSERWVILTFLSSADVGVYAVMITLANYAVTVPQGILTQFATPFIYERFSGPPETARIGEGQAYLRYFSFCSAALVGLVTLAAALFGKDAIIFLSSEQYAGWWYLLPLLCLGTGLFHVGQALSLLGLSLNLPHRYMFPKIVSGALAVALNVLLLSLFGMVGIAVSVCLAGFFYLLLIMAVNTRIRAAVDHSGEWAS